MEFETFVKDYAELSDGAELIMTIRDLTAGRRKYNARIVRGLVWRAEEAPDACDALRVRSVVGRRFEQRWALQIVEELGAVVPGRPYSDVFEALQQFRRTKVTT